MSLPFDADADAACCLSRKANCANVLGSADMAPFVRGLFILLAALLFIKFHFRLYTLEKP